MTSSQRRAVIAIGGNALIGEGQQGTIAEQFDNARAAACEVANLVEAGWRIVVTHGNGPQVGFILRSEMLENLPFIPKLSLDMCVADSEGGVGYIVTNSLLNELARRGLADRAVCVLTQTVVDASDPAFGRPTKPIGPPFSAEEAAERRERDGWSMIEEAGRGFRRVVASPVPRRIVEAGAIRQLIEAGFVVVAAGGGGIPVIETEPGVYRGVEAVIDKDLASAYLAASLDFPLLVISTGVERVAIRAPRSNSWNAAVGDERGQAALELMALALADGDFVFTESAQPAAPSCGSTGAASRTRSWCSARSTTSRTGVSCMQTTWSPSVNRSPTRSRQHWCPRASVMR